MTRHFGALLAAIIFFCCLSSVKAEGDTSQSRSLSVEAFFAVGYTGFSQFLGPTVTMGNSEFYLGPKVNLDNTYLPGHTHMGLAAGYRQFYVRSEKFVTNLSNIKEALKLNPDFVHTDDIPLTRNVLQSL